MIHLGDRSLMTASPNGSHYLAILCSSKRQNVNSNRILHTFDNGEVFMWCEYLMKLNGVSPNFLLSPYICDATFEKVCTCTLLLIHDNCVHYHIGVG